MNWTRLRSARLACSLAILWAVATEIRAEQNFKRLTGKEIRSRVIGKVITDEVHWSDYFRKDGTLVSLDMGRKSTGFWTIAKNELCIQKKSIDGTTCYQVWVAGDEVSLRLEGIDPAPFVSYIREYEGE